MTYYSFIPSRFPGRLKMIQIHWALWMMIMHFLLRGMQLTLTLSTFNVTPSPYYVFGTLFILRLLFCFDAKLWIGLNDLGLPCLCWMTLVLLIYCLLYNLIWLFLWQLVMTYEFVTLTWNEIVCYLINFLGLYKLLAPALNMNFFNSFGLFLPLVWLKI